jgi:hypothetical protein
MRGADSISPVNSELRRLPLVMLFWLLVQFLLGMAVNLFVTITRDHPGANPPEYFSGVAQSVTWAVLQGPVLLVLHATLGLILLVGGIAVAVRAVQLGPRSFATACVVGAVAILAAGLNGGSFLNYNEDFSSMIMAALFAIAVMAYVFAIYIASGADRSLAPRV